MAIGDLSSKVSTTAANQLHNKDNPPDFEDGFGDDDDFDFADLFDDIDMGSFGGVSSTTNNSDISGSSSTFGGSSLSGGSSFNSSFDGSGFGTPSGGFGGGGFGTGGFRQQQQEVKQKKPDTFDVMFEAAGKSTVSLGKVVMDIIRSTRSRNADDIGLFSKNIIFTGIGITGASLVMALIGIFGKMGQLMSLSIRAGTAGLLCIGTGLVGIGSAAIRIVTRGEYIPSDLESLPEVNNSENISYEDDFDDADSFDDIFGELFGDDFDDDEDDELDDELDDFDFSSIAKQEEDAKDIEENKKIPMGEQLGEIEDKYNSMVENVQSNQPILNRSVLFNIFKDYFPLNTPGFSEKEEVYSGSDEFMSLRTLCTQALASAAKKEVDEINSNLTKATSTYFCYELRMDRVKGLTKLDDIAREVEAYFRDNAEDYAVVADVQIERDDYRIVITKGVKAIVTFGDCFQLDTVCDYMLDQNNGLPIIAGIDDYGNPVLADAKDYTTLLIAGKPRSGKSWYVNAIIFSLLTFNTPEDIQLLIIDPKESNLFNTVGLMPHVCGLHNDSNVLQIMDDLIEIEGARRKKLLADNMCEDIWELRERKGIKLPILYLVIDEVMTVLANLEKSGTDKEFSRLLNIIITQLPSQGICVMIVPHRSTGVVNKTSRVNMAFTAAVMAEEEVIKETLDIKRWDRALTQKGDVALKVSGMTKAKFVKGAALTDSNSKNTILITSIAKTFYKMGVYIPDMRSIGCGYNRDEDKIKEKLELSSDSKRVQFDIDDVTDSLDTLIKDGEF